MVKFTVLGQPVPKGRPRFTRTGRTYTPPKTVAYERAVSTVAHAAMVTQAVMAMRVDVHVIIKLYYGDRRRRDIDNGAKALLDAMNGIVYDDDAQVSKLTVFRFYDKENPRAVVEVFEPDIG